MTRFTLARLGATFTLAGVVIAACSGTGTASSPASAAASASPSAAVESPSSSTAASPAASASASASASAAVGSPAARTVQMYAIDGGFQNPPVDPTPGTILTLRNLGKEAHEMVVVRRNADATAKQTFENAFKDPTKLDPAALRKWVTVVGALAADPGQEAQGQIVLDQPGEYAVVDLLPKGTTTAPASPDPMAIPSGVPNAATGMFTTFSVIQPEAS